MILEREFTTPIIQRPVDDSLVLWIKGNGSRNFTNLATDLSEKNNNGQLLGGTIWLTNNFQNVLSFDGVDDYVRVLGSSSLNLSGNNESIFMWIRHTSNNIFMQSNSRNRRLYSNYWSFNDSSNTLYSVSSGNHNDGLFHLVGYTAKDNVLRTYFDGRLFASSTRSSGVNAVRAAGNSPNGDYWDFGRLMSGSDTLYFNGIIGEIRVYNRALSDSEIRELFNSTRHLYGR